MACHFVVELHDYSAALKLHRPDNVWPAPVQMIGCRPTTVIVKEVRRPHAYMVGVEFVGPQQRNSVTIWSVLEPNDEKHVHVVIDFYIFGFEVHDHGARN